MTPVFFQSRVDQRIESSVVTTLLPHPGTEGKSRKTGREKTSEGYFQPRLPVGRHEQRRADPGPAQPVERLRQPAKPVQREKGSRGMSKNALGAQGECLDHLLKKSPRLGHRRHVAPDSVGLTIPGPIEAHRPIPGVSDERRSPIMPRGMVSKPMQNEDLPLFGTGGKPLAHAQFYPPVGNMKNTVKNS